jgi:hypothetical protein
MTESSGIEVYYRKYESGFDKVNLSDNKGAMSSNG